HRRLSAPGVAGGALLVVDDVDAASPAGRRPVRPRAAAGPAALCRLLGGDDAGRELRRHRRAPRLMPLRNRVTPLGELIPAPARGLVYGNRGCLHDDQGNVRRRWAVRRWIACRLEFKGWQRGPMMQPGKFTELF